MTESQLWDKKLKLTNYEISHNWDKDETNKKVTIMNYKRSESWQKVKR